MGVIIVVFFDKFKKKGLNSPGFAKIDSEEKVMKLANEGILKPLFLRPLRFDGKDSVQNRLFVPPVIVELKERYDDMVENLHRQDKVSSYSCIPEYRGRSTIPSKLTIIAGKDGMAIFTETIKIW